MGRRVEEKMDGWRVKVDGQVDRREGWLGGWTGMETAREVRPPWVMDGWIKRRWRVGLEKGRQKRRCAKSRRRRDRQSDRACFRGAGEEDGRAERWTGGRWGREWREGRRKRLCHKRAPSAGTGRGGQAGAVLPGLCLPPRAAHGPTSGPCCPPCQGSPFEEQGPWPPGVPGLGLLRAHFLRSPKGEHGYGQARRARTWACHTAYHPRPLRGGVQGCARQRRRVSPREGGLLIHPAGWDVMRATGRGSPLGHWAASGAPRAKGWAEWGRRSSRPLSPHSAQPLSGSWPQGQEPRACLLCRGSVEPPPCRTWGQGLPTAEVKRLRGATARCLASALRLDCLSGPSRQPPAPQLWARSASPTAQTSNPLQGPQKHSGCVGEATQAGKGSL